jgi:hypothetical protein
MINYSFYSTIIRGDWGICSLWPGNSPVISRECPVAAGYPISGRTSVGSWAGVATAAATPGPGVREIDPAISLDIEDR